MTTTSKCMSFTSNSTGGEYHHALSFFEMPAHGHEIGIWGTSGALKTNAWEFMTIQGSHYSDNKSHNVNSIHTNASGSGTPHNNLQPYIVVFFWRRTN